MMRVKHRSELTAVNIINGVFGLFLIASPWLFGFTGEQAATWNAALVGVLLGAVALTGVIDLREREGWASLALGLWAMVAPWVIGFSGVVNAMWTHVGVGLATAILAAVELWMLHHNPRQLAS
jgi:hypothetical protein